MVLVTFPHSYSFTPDILARNKLTLTLPSFCCLHRVKVSSAYRLMPRALPSAQVQRSSVHLTLTTVAPSAIPGNKLISTLPLISYRWLVTPVAEASGSLHIRFLCIYSSFAYAAQHLVCNQVKLSTLNIRKFSRSHQFARLTPTQKASTLSWLLKVQCSRIAQ